MTRVNNANYPMSSAYGSILRQREIDRAEAEAKARGEDVKPQFYAGQTVDRESICHSVLWCYVGKACSEDGTYSFTYFDRKHNLLVTFEGFHQSNAITRDATDDPHLNEYIDKAIEEGNWLHNLRSTNRAGRIW